MKVKALYSSLLSKGAMNSKERRRAKNRETLQVFRDGKKGDTKPVSSFGNTGIPVKTMKRPGKKYQCPRRDRLQMAITYGGKAQTGKGMTGTHWMNDPREVWRD